MVYGVMCIVNILYAQKTIENMRLTMGDRRSSGAMTRYGELSMKATTLKV